MTSRERVLAALDHREPDRVPIDFGSTSVTGIHASCVAGLREYYGLEKRPVKVHEPYQMLGLMEADLKNAMGLDVNGVFGRKTLFGFENKRWKEWDFNGQIVLMSEDFRTITDENGDVLVFPQGDTSAPPSAKMPKGGHFFDCLIRQDPIDEDHLNAEDNLEEFGLISEEDLAHFKKAVAEAKMRRTGGDRQFRRHEFWECRAGARPGPEAPQGHT